MAISSLILFASSTSIGISLRRSWYCSLFCCLSSCSLIFSSDLLVYFLNSIAGICEDVLARDYQTAWFRYFILLENYLSWLRRASQSIFFDSRLFFLRMSSSNFFSYSTYIYLFWYSRYRGRLSWLLERVLIIIVFLFSFFCFSSFNFYYICFFFYKIAAALSLSSFYFITFSSSSLAFCSSMAFFSLCVSSSLWDTTHPLTLPSTCQASQIFCSFSLRICSCISSMMACLALLYWPSSPKSPLLNPCSALCSSLLFDNRLLSLPCSYALSSSCAMCVGWSPIQMWPCVSQWLMRALQVDMSSWMVYMRSPGRLFKCLLKYCPTESILYTDGIIQLLVGKWGDM